jgi:hypothetical protein
MIRFRYKHLDMADLEEQLKKADGEGAKVRMIATDGRSIHQPSGTLKLTDRYVVQALSAWMATWRPWTRSAPLPTSTTYVTVLLTCSRVRLPKPNLLFLCSRLS